MGGGNLPTERHQGLAIGFVELGAIQRFDQIRTQLVGFLERLIAAETIHFRMIAGKQHVRNLDATPFRGLRVLSVLQQRETATSPPFNT